jgi:mannose-6-phosphate isomerase-like protein (cupin superfamily)
MDIVNLADVTPFRTKDGSEIRELLAHRNSSLRHQSLAEARLPRGAATTPHYHPLTEEIYYILEGSGEMRIGDEARHVESGDAIAIPPGKVHQILNRGESVLRFLCCCAPPYEHHDTVLLENTGRSD